MAVRKIVTIPNEVLNTKSEKIRTIDQSVKDLAQDLLDTLNVAKDPEGAGIAANQIGVAKKVCVVRNFFDDPSNRNGYSHEDYVLINPKIVSTSKETEIEYEGCLSVPDTYGEVERFSKIKVDAQDLAGNGIRIKAGGYFARTIQHEIDHLNGILFTQRIVGKAISEKELEDLYEVQAK